MPVNNKARRCKARTKSGKPCRAAVTAGGLCFFHANPDKASELGRIGGKGNRHVSGGHADSLPTLDTAIAVRDTVARLIAEVHAGTLHPRVATGLAPLLSLQLRAIETTDVVRRIEALEKLAQKTADAPNGFRADAGSPDVSRIGDDLPEQALPKTDTDDSAEVTTENP